MAAQAKATLCGIRPLAQTHCLFGTTLTLWYMHRNHAQPHSAIPKVLLKSTHWMQLDTALLVASTLLKALW